MPEIFAHRGLHVTERENTLEAFRAAKALGVDGVELDVRRSADGVLVIHHDALIGDMVIASTAAAALPSYVPTLDQAMGVLEGLKVNVEIKNLRDPREPTYDESGDFARVVLSELLHGPWDRAGIISSFDLATLDVLRATDPDVRLGWLLWSQDLAGAITTTHERGLNAVHPPYWRLDATHAQHAKDLSLEVNVWTVNEPSGISSMLALGVTSIISDAPAAAMALVAS